MPNLTPEDITPAAPAAVAPAPAPAAAGGADSPELLALLEQDGEIPEDVLRIPAFNALLEGKPGAIYMKRGEAIPEAQTIMKYAPDLIKAGFGFYAADSQPVNVLFNSLVVTPQELAEADKAGTLDQIAAPFNEVKAAYDQLISEDQAKAGKTPAAAPTGAPSVPGPSGAPMPASAQRQLAKARVDVIEPGSPTSGPSPGQGRILNALKKPVV